MIAAIHYKKNEAGQFEYISSGVQNGDTAAFLAKVEKWNNEHEDDKYKVYDDPLIVQLVMKLIEIREKNDEGRLSDTIDSIKETVDEVVQDLDGLTSLVRRVQDYLKSQEEANESQ